MEPHPYSRPSSAHSFPPLKPTTVPAGWKPGKYQNAAVTDPAKGRSAGGVETFNSCCLCTHCPGDDKLWVLSTTDASYGQYMHNLLGVNHFSDTALIFCLVCRTAVLELFNLRKAVEVREERIRKVLELRGQHMMSLGKPQPGEYPSSTHVAQLPENGVVQGHSHDPGNETSDVNINTERDGKTRHMGVFCKLEKVSDDEGDAPMEETTYHERTEATNESYVAETPLNNNMPTEQANESCLTSRGHGNVHTIRGKTKPSRQCPFCGQKFWSHSRYNFHIRVEHHAHRVDISSLPPIMVVEEGGRTLHCCPKCQKRFARRANVIDHLAGVHLLNTSTRMFCSICEKYFKTSDAFNDHAQLHREHDAQSSAYVSSGMSDNPCEAQDTFQEQLKAHLSSRDGVQEGTQSGRLVQTTWV